MTTRTRFVALVALLGAAFVSGCSHGGAARHPIVISSEATGILVQGHGEVDAAPDVAVVNLGIEAQAPTVEQARDQGAASANRVMAALENGGVARKDIQTSGLSIAPRYEYPPQSKPILAGYVVSNSLTVKIRRLDNASRILDAAVRAGGDDMRVHGIHFEIDDPTKFRAMAREKAVNEARAKAEQLAALSGVDLGEPILVEEVAFHAPIVPMAAAEMMAKDASTPIAPGQTTVSVDIRVRWSIEG